MNFRTFIIELSEVIELLLLNICYWTFGRYKNCPLFTHSIFYWYTCIHFRVGEGQIFCWGFFHREMFHEEGSFQGVNLSGEIIHCGNLPQFLYKILFMSCFLFSVSILRAEWIRLIVRGKLSPGLNCLEDISMVRGFLHGGWVRFPGII